MLFRWIAAVSVLITGVGTAVEIRPPGETPLPYGAHALMGGRVVVKPGLVVEGATVLIRNGRIQDVLPKEKPGIPADARVWEMKGKTIYAGFIDPYLSLGDNKARPVSNRWIVPIEARAGISFKGVPTTREDLGGKGPGYEIAEIHPQQKISDDFTPDSKAFAGLRELGFTAANFIPTKGIIRGNSALALLGDGDPNRLLLRPQTLQHMALEPAKDYPHSLMGVIAAIRQTVLDAHHHEAMKTWSQRNPNGPRPEYNPALDSLNSVLRAKAKQRVVVEPGSVLMTARMAKLAQEMKFNPVMVATGQEWRRPEILEQFALPYIVPVIFPAAPDLPEEQDWDQVSLDQLRAWDWAPEVPALLAKNKRPFSFTLHGLGDHKSFRRNIQQAIQRGLSADVALAALTTEPAALLGAEADLGTIEKGRLANLTVVDGDSWFNPDQPVSSVWIEGRHYVNDPQKKKDEDSNKAEAPADPVPRAAKIPGNYRGVIKGPASVLILNATVWTCGPSGVITNASIRIADGRIAAIGPEIGAPIPFDGIIIDAKGKHVTPGLIDCHSHSMILGGVNEATLPSTAMVRIADVVNSETENIYRQLAGGLTMANLLHGSANPIGGQNAVVKLRYGAMPDEMIFSKAPAGIKFALGENVKQSNWGDKKTTRFPQTRMGVKTFFINRFTAARQYLAGQRANLVAGPPVRRNLELDALGEILNGERLIHCHSYRQDEMLVFLRTMERFGIRVGSLQHVLEGYKIADEIAAHGAGASSFADWWAYKFEVYDAIPYNGALLHERGAVVSFNSDSSDLARRLNLEASKAVKYGGVPEAEALKFVTLNPAKQLGIDRWVGSLEVGKDADFVIWNGHPLNTQTLCDETWIEGRQYYDRAKAGARFGAMAEERAALLAKARKRESNENAGLAARAAFFRRVLEKAHTLNNCYECRKAKP